MSMCFGWRCVSERRIVGVVYVLGSGFSILLPPMCLRGAGITCSVYAAWDDV